MPFDKQLECVSAKVPSQLAVALLFDNCLLSCKTSSCWLLLEEVQKLSILSSGLFAIPIISVQTMQNFDEVLVPTDHVSRNPNDTYYIDTETVLRCHTSAHQAELLRRGEAAFLVTGTDTLPSVAIAAQVHKDGIDCSGGCSRVPR